MKLAVGLVHHPVFDRQKEIVATNITNLDVHDIARVSRVYAVDKYFVIHPSQEQLMFVERLLDHWRVGDGKKFNPMRATALTMVETAASIDHACQKWMGDRAKVRVLGTTARQIAGVERIPFQRVREEIKAGANAKADRESMDGENFKFSGKTDRGGENKSGGGEQATMILFGTGFGMTEELLLSCDGLLEPLKGAPPLDYRHLSVRSAVSICLDRLLGTW